MLASGFSCQRFCKEEEIVLIDFWALENVNISF